jgi:hypothetical protein
MPYRRLAIDCHNPMHPKGICEDSGPSATARHLATFRYGPAFVGRGRGCSQHGTNCLPCRKSRVRIPTAAIGQFYSGIRGRLVVALPSSGTEVRLGQAEMGRLLTVSLVNNPDAPVVKLTLLLPRISFAGASEQPVKTLAIVSENRELAFTRKRPVGQVLTHRAPIAQRDSAPVVRRGALGAMSVHGAPGAPLRAVPAAGSRTSCGSAVDGRPSATA